MRRDYLTNFARAGAASGAHGAVRHQVPLERPENEPTTDLFGHIRNRPSKPMKALAVISILALLTVTGAAYSDQVLTSDQHAAQRGK
jgi:hypothetical protein